MRALILGICLAVATAARAGVFIVNNNGDAPDANPGNGGCLSAGGVCTLRAAIDEANALPGEDEIDVPAMTIATNGYTISDPVRILGSTAGGVPQTLVSGGGFKTQGSGAVQLTGFRIVGVSGIGIDLATSGNRIYDSYVGSVLVGDAGNTGDGIRSAGGNTIEDVYVSGNGQHGIECVGAGGDRLSHIIVGLRNDGLTASPNALSGVLINAPKVTIRAVTVQMPSVLSGNTGPGLEVLGSGVVVDGAYVGTNAAGTAAVPNGQCGIKISGSDATIGSTRDGTNLLSGNDGPGVCATGSNNLQIYGNYIGLDKTLASPIANQGPGILLENTVGTVIGNPSFLSAVNRISANAGDGIRVIGSGTSNVQIYSNFIGLPGAPTTAGGNVAGIYLGGQSTGTRVGDFQKANTITKNVRGIVIEDSSDNLIDGNLIGYAGPLLAPAGNQFEGILVFGTSATNNRITRNAILNNSIGVAIRETAGSTVDGNAILDNGIASNQTLGIDLQSPAAGIDANDALDGDAGANQAQNYPLITCASTVSGSTTVAGTLASQPLTTYLVEVFSSASCGAQGYGEGAFRIGTVSVTTDAQGNGSFNATFPMSVNATSVLTATATDPSNNTSEFSPCAPLAANTVSVASSATVSESAGQVLIVVTKGASATPSSVQYTTIDGTATAGQDYTAVSGTIAFAACETQKTVAVPITNDAIDEPNEQFTFHLFNAIGTAIANADESVQITDDDPTPTITLSLTGSPIAENGGVATVTATASNPSSQPITVNLAFTGTATNGADYTPSASAITIPAMQTTGSITLTAVDDGNDEPDETIVVTGDAQSVTATIADDDETAIEPVPTLSEGALIALAAMVAAVGAVALRR